MQRRKRADDKKVMSVANQEDYDGLWGGVQTNLLQKLSEELCLWRKGATLHRPHPALLLTSIARSVKSHFRKVDFFRIPYLKNLL